MTDLEAKLAIVKPRHLRFEVDPYTGGGHYTRVRVMTRERVQIGVIEYYGLWRTFAFSSPKDTVWSDDCLSDVQRALAIIKREILE